MDASGRAPLIAGAANLRPTVTSQIVHPYKWAICLQSMRISLSQSRAKAILSSLALASSSDMDKGGGAMTKKQTVVLYPPSGAVGHVGPMTQLGKVFLEHGFDVTMVLLETPVCSRSWTDSDAASSCFFTESVVANNPSISFHVLPPIDFPTNSTKHPHLLMLEMMARYNDKLEAFLRSIVPRERLHSLVVDMCCVSAVDVAAKLRVPVYTFFPSSAGALAVLTQLPALLAGRRAGLRELGDAPLEFAGSPPMPASHLIEELLGHPEEDEVCRTLVAVWTRNAETRGILVNTFEALESRAVEALLKGVPGQVCWPQIYCVGPLVAAERRHGEEDECLDWLDAQPERSVVFLCWGSTGSLPEEQLKEIAVGLDKSGQRFLWVVPVRRTPDDDDPNNKQSRFFLPQDGFSERTRGRGLVLCDSWAPQVEILNHPATGAFVTHCGWNSALEAVAAGVPMLCWPLGAEQKMNKVFMTQGGDMGVAVEMEGYDTGLVTAEEVEAKVRLVMESGGKGAELRKRAIELRKQAGEALQDGGSSHAAFLRFLEDASNTN